jgi:hypothetical protein
MAYSLLPNRPPSTTLTLAADKVHEMQLIKSRGLSPWQFALELSKNGAEACMEYMKKHPEDRDYEGRVLLTEESPDKDRQMMIVDNGVGMNPEELAHYFTGLHESSDLKRKGGKNFGVGAKDTLYNKGRFSVISLEKNADTAFMITIDMYEGLKWGIMPVLNHDTGEEEDAIPVEINKCHELIQEAGHGTQIILLERESALPNTHGLNNKAKDINGVWLKVQNKFWYNLPDKITISEKFMGPPKNANEERTWRTDKLKSLSDTLRANSLHNGVVRYKGIDIEWYYKDPNAPASNRRENSQASTSYVHDGKVVEFFNSNAHKALAHGFTLWGIWRKVSFVINTHQNSDYKPDISRNKLMHKGTEVPIEAIQKYFVENMPEKLQQLQKQEFDKTSKTSPVDLLSKLNKFLPYLKMSKYITKKNGDFLSDTPELGHYGRERSSEERGFKPINPGPGVLDKFLNTKLSKKGEKSKKVNSPFPSIEWVPEDYNGDELLNIGAIYIEKEKIILANQDFVAIENIINYLKTESAIELELDIYRKAAKYAIEEYLLLYVASIISNTKKMRLKSEECLSSDVLTGMIMSPALFQAAQKQLSIEIKAITNSQKAESVMVEEPVDVK